MAAADPGLAALTVEELIEQAELLTGALGATFAELRTRGLATTGPEPGHSTRPHFPGGCWCALSHTPAGAAEINRRRPR